MSDASTYLKTPIDYLKGVGPQRAKVLRSELNIQSYDDLLHFYPNRYVDRSQFLKVAQLTEEVQCQVIGKITHLKTVGEKRGKRLVATFTDDSGSMELVWFRGIKYLKDSLKLNLPYVAFGKVAFYGGRPSMAHPELDLLENYKREMTGSMQPVYPSTEKLGRANITNKVLVKMMTAMLKDLPPLTENLSSPLLKQHKLLDRNRAMRNIHFPKDQNFLAHARNRLKFEELFFMQLQLLLTNQINKSRIKGYVFEKIGDSFNTFYSNHLPFELTGAQKRVVKEIRQDMGSGAQMNRLLQGDVGSGKTIVALLSALIAIDNGFQACIMAPTEILAQQHYAGLTELLDKTGVEVALLTGSVKQSKRIELHAALEDGRIKLLVGTHALIEEKVKFQNLGLAIVDEQHRFGVAQRAKLWKKNDLPPHVLVMTATPIPRTLAMSLYGDLDVSVIDELPPGRKEIKTVHRYDSKRLSVFHFLKQEIAKGRQVYIVYPLIQESQKLDYKDLMDGYESITREFPLPDFRVSVVHGQMKAEDKDHEMQQFVEGKTHIMVATTVIEVGVNVPNASVMVIESAERFGLSQLHQLRGRVGRGAEQSYCILMTGSKLSNDAKTRMQTMVKTTDGFEIAEVDLKLRGPGDLMGTQQSGVLNMRMADIVKDNQLMRKIRHIAQEVLDGDPGLKSAESRPMRLYLQKHFRHQALWKFIS